MSRMNGLAAEYVSAGGYAFQEFTVVGHGFPPEGRCGYLGTASSMPSSSRFSSLPRG